MHVTIDTPFAKGENYTYIILLQIVTLERFLKF
jgi:hypothetical protein